MTFHRVTQSKPSWECCMISKWEKYTLTVKKITNISLVLKKDKGWRELIIALLCFPAGVSICRRLPWFWWRAGSLHLQRASRKSCVWRPMQDEASYWAEAPVSVGWRNGASVELWQSGEQKADFREQKQDKPKESLLSGVVKPAVYKKCSTSLWYLYPYTQYFHCNGLQT